MITRVGNGYDVHRLVSGRKLIIGGVDIPNDKGLLGHSDADVLLHAICDALLGAAGQGDIGKHFPDSDNRFRGISSLILLREVGSLVFSLGFYIGNIDAIIVAQHPKMAPHIMTMIDNISKSLQVNKSLINIKATTTEGLGFVGASEGIAAYAVCSLTSAETS